MRLIGRQPSRMYASVLAGGFLMAACTAGEGPSGRVAYYRTHPAEWERAVWICTNHGSAFVSTIGCANALALLDEADIRRARGGVSAASFSHSSRSVARN